MKETIVSRGVEFLRPFGDEKSEQAQILILIGALGGKAYTLGTRRQQYCNLCGARTTDQGTRQTEGIGDLVAFLPPSPRDRERGASWIHVWIEVKGRGGALTPDQVAFRDLCRLSRIAHIVGGIDAFMAWLVDGGWIRK